MRITDVITQCDRVKPNEYSYAQKRDWMIKLESEIRQYAAQYSYASVDNFFSDEENPVLFLDDNNSDIYLFYIISMIDLFNQEYELYNNSSSFYNDRLRKWQKRFRRENMPKCKISITV